MAQFAIVVSWSIMKPILRSKPVTCRMSVGRNKIFRDRAIRDAYHWLKAAGYESV